MRDSAMRSSKNESRPSPPPSPVVPYNCQDPQDLSNLADRIDWATYGDLLVTGQLVALDADTVARIRKSADIAVVRKTAKRLNLSPLLLVIGLLARTAAPCDRHADRVYRVLLGQARPRDLAHAADRLGLNVGADVN